MTKEQRELKEQSLREKNMLLEMYEKAALLYQSQGHLYHAAKRWEQYDRTRKQIIFLEWELNQK